MSRAISRAWDVYNNEGLSRLLNSSASFSSRVLSPKQASISGLVKLLTIYYRKDLKQYCKESAGDNSIFYYSEREEHMINEPTTPDDIPTKFRDVVGEHTMQRPFVATVENVTIHENGLVTTSDGAIILETLNSRRDQLEDGMSYKNFIDVIGAQLSNGSEVTDCDYKLACPLISSTVFGKPNLEVSSYNGHSGILLNLLPRLEGVREYEERYDRYPILLLGPSIRPLLREMIELLGFDQNRIVEWNGERVEMKEMIIPSVRSPENKIGKYYHDIKGHANYKFISKLGAEWVRDTSVSNIDQEDDQFSDRIYISRQDASCRRVHNQEDLINLLSRYNFQPYELSKYSWKEQVQMFYNAEAVVAPHGAGLANIMFCTDCKVIEIFGPKRKPTFFMLAEKNSQYYGMTTEKTEGDDIIVNVEKISDLIETMGISE